MKILLGRETVFDAGKMKVLPKANYSEDESPDAQDLYARTKLLGEVSGQNCPTIRTSIVGHELQGSNGLLVWFLSQH
jgi:dTDP-4-dehydrorhamnose reductase